RQGRDNGPPQGTRPDGGRKPGIRLLRPRPRRLPRPDDPGPETVGCPICASGTRASGGTPPEARKARDGDPDRIVLAPSGLVRLRCRLDPEQASILMRITIMKPHPMGAAS